MRYTLLGLGLTVMCAFWAAVAQGPGVHFFGVAKVIVPPGAARDLVVFGAALRQDGTASPATDVFTAADDGSGLRQLTGFPTDVQPPVGVSEVSVSADGARAAYTALVRRGPLAVEAVNVIDIASTTERTVAIDPGQCPQPACPNCFLSCLSSPHITPDGKRILYSSASGTRPFYVVNADGAGSIQLPIATGELARGPQRVISRDERVVFASAAVSQPSSTPQSMNVYLMKLDGADVSQVTRFPGESFTVYGATLSTDGRSIVFESNYDPASSNPAAANRIWFVRSDGSGLRALTDVSDGATSPSLSSDGSLAVFVRAGQIWSVHTDGTTPATALTAFMGAKASDPVITDNTSPIFFVVEPVDGRPSVIYSVRTDGTDLRPVFPPNTVTAGPLGRQCF